MLQHHDMYRDGVERHQREAHAWATADRFGRAERASRLEARKRRGERARSHAHKHSMHARVRALRMHVRAWVSPLVPHTHHH